VNIKADQLRVGDVLYEPSGDKAGQVLELRVDGEQVRLRITQPGILVIGSEEEVTIDRRATPA